MATSTCIKCGGTNFELQTLEPFGSKYKLTAVQCSGCGGVIGVVEYTPVSELMKELARKLNVPLP